MQGPITIPPPPPPQLDCSIQIHQRVDNHPASNYRLLELQVDDLQVLLFQFQYYREPSHLDYPILIKLINTRNNHNQVEYCHEP